MIKQILKKAYRKFLYSFFKGLEKRSRTLFFPLFEFFFPRFNSFRFFGLPNGIEKIEGEEMVGVTSFLSLPPKTVNTEILPKFAPLHLETSPCKLAVLKNGFSTATGATLTAKGKLVPEFTEQFTMRGDIYNHQLFKFRKERFRAKIPHFDATVLPLTVDGQWNYYHWLFDALPKIHLMKKKGIVPDFYYANTSRTFQIQSLKLLGIGSEKIISADQYFAISASSLIATTFPCLTGYPQWVCNFLRNEFLKPSIRKTAPIFISRKGASYRRILNEEEIEPFLIQKGFQIVQPEKLSFLEQIDVFQSAEAIVAPHGAGLANLVFCLPQTRVIEIFPPRFICTCYWSLSNLVGLDYYAHVALDAPETYSEECVGYDHILLDTKKFIQTIENTLRGCL